MTITLPGHPLPAVTLPAPARERWQPLRAGLVDLFYYDVEEFWFHDGRLLLRGNNGTGKSKVLALLLPFLLDGDLSPHRVEPDADHKKRMEWNLLLGGEHPHPERLGYSWLEFGRIGENGPEFRTIGCGLKAVFGRGIAKHWFFVTGERIGDGLHLVDATRTALTRERLSEALSGLGTVYDRARDYRRAVDEALFGLGEQRYGALVDLLVQLRQPQLSKRPSEKALSDALTEALPPLDQAVVADVAEAFRSLEEDRDELTAMTEAHTSARGFLGHYRRYAAVATRRRAERPRRAEADYRAARESLAAAEEAHRVADTTADEAAEQLDELAVRFDILRAQDTALRASPEMRSAHELDRRATEAARRQVDSTNAAGERARAVADVEERTRRHTATQSRSDVAERELGTHLRGTADAAAGARIGTRHNATIGAPLDAGAGPDPAAADGLLRTLRREAAELVARQERALRHVDGLLDAEAEAARALAAARREADRLDDAAGALAERRATAAVVVHQEGSALVEAVRRHLADSVELAVPEPDAVLAALELWVCTLDGPDPARAAVDTAGRAAVAALAGLRAGFEQTASAAAARASELAAEIGRLEAGEDDAPPVPYTRGPQIRAERLGAPFWQRIDFAAHVPATDRAGLEAALEASGVLDAWLDPDGTLRGVDNDVLLAPDGVADGSALSSVLIPAVDPEDPRAAAVSDAAVVAVLRSIGLRSVGLHSVELAEREPDRKAQTWVSTDGRFRIGPLAGGWSKPVAQYIGRGAREAARRARLAQLRSEAAEVAVEQEFLAAELTTLERRRARLDTEIERLPPTSVLRDAHATVIAVAAEQVRLAVEQAAARDRLSTAGDEAQSATEALHTGAADVDLPADRTGLAAVRDQLGAYREALAGLWPAVSTLTLARNAVAEAATDLHAASQVLVTATERAVDAERAASTSRQEYETLRATVGAAVEELQTRLAAVADQVTAAEQEQKAARMRHTNAVADRGRAEGRREAATGALATATLERSDAAESMRRFAATGLLGVALPDLALPAPDASWAPEPTVRLARQIDQELAASPVDDPTWDRVQRRVTEELKTLTDTLARQGNRASAQLLEDGILVEVVFRGRPATVPELTQALSTEVADRTRLLDEREREVLENHLVNEVASTLQELITEAERQVRLMNAELDGRPTSTGMRLRLEWRPREDGPAGLAEARRRLLRQSADAWSAPDRAAVGGFLQDRIAEMRARDETGTWLDHLTRALDYRGWHRFVIERHQSGQWRPATGPASGGERVLAASVPLFAAASAHYASAGNPHAPRLVTLDEAFAGVDDNARAKYLGLLAAFDLDVVMTSEREWGCYPEVPGLAIAQLSRTDGVPAVLVSNWRWDGEQRRPVPRPAAVPRSTAVPEPAAPGTAQHDSTEGLF